MGNDADPNISIHAPVLGATLTNSCRLGSWKYFNPRTRAGCDVYVAYAVFLIIYISIHAPVLGATKEKANKTHYMVGFQSTHPCWVRLCTKSIPASANRISIHAPVLGATDPRRRSAINFISFQSTHPCWVRRIQKSFDSDEPRYFNPRTRAGCDAVCCLCDDIFSIISIHAPVLGATYTVFEHRPGVRDFNPRTRAGCDL